MKTTDKLITATTLITAMLASSPVMALEAGDVLVRTRIINISPDVNSNQVYLNDGTPLSPPAGIDVDDTTTLDIDFTYMFTDNFGVELLLDISSTHDITGTGNLAGVNIGDVTVLPPALIAQWHFMPDQNMRPYVGAGINYTFFFNESTTDQFNNAVAATATGLTVDDTFGLVAQAGIDIDISEDWFVNLDVKYFALDTSAHVSVDGVDTAYVDFDLNPLVLGIGIGTHF